MLSRTIAAVLLGGVVLSGCTTPGNAPPGNAPAGHAPANSAAAADRADTLWKQRTDFVGDNSRVIWLTRSAGFGPDGSYTISLQTAAKPYGLTVTFDKGLGKPVDGIDFTAPSTLLLGTIGNLGAVHVEAPGRSFDLTAAQASKQLGYDVKTLGRDQQKLTDYVHTLDD